MLKFEFSIHAQNMLAKRKIPEEWVWRTINDPEMEFIGDDSNNHYTKAIVEKAGRVLHVVVNPYVQPNRIVTLFFDRRLRKKDESKN
jgi:hypothetical protein